MALPTRPSWLRDVVAREEARYGETQGRHQIIFGRTVGKREANPIEESVERDALTHRRHFWMVMPEFG